MLAGPHPAPEHVGQDRLDDRLPPQSAVEVRPVIVKVGGHRILNFVRVHAGMAGRNVVGERGGSVGRGGGNEYDSLT
jgi:hypothetical protein